MASSVIGLLRVILSANSAEYDTVMRKAAVTANVTAKEIEATSTSAKGLTGAFQGLGGAASMIGLTLGGITAVGLVKSLVDSASAVNDLSERLGVSTDAVQRWKFAADQTGSSIDDFATAMGQLQKKVTEGGNATEEALHRLGLTIEQVRGLDPATLFETVAEAIKDVKDPTERAAVAMELFGRGGTKILPALIEGVKELGDKAEATGNIMSGNTIKAADDLGDSFTALLGTGKNLIAGVLGPFLPALSLIAQGITVVVGEISNLLAWVNNIISPFNAWKQVVDGVSDALVVLGLKTQETAKIAGTASASLKKYWGDVAAQAKIPDDALKDLDATYRELSDRQKEANETTDKDTEAWKKHQEELKKAKEAEEALKTTVIEMTAALRDQYDQQQLAIAQWGEFDQALQMLPITDVVGKIQDYSTEAEIAQTNTDLLTGAFKTLGITSRAELQQIADKAKQAYEIISQQLGKTSPEAIEAFKKWQAAAKEAAGETKKSWSDVFPHITGIIGQMGSAIQGTFDSMLLGAKGFKDGFLDIWKDLKAGVAKILTEILGDFVNRFLKGLLAELTGAQGGFASAFKGLLGGGLGSLLGGGTAFAGAAGVPLINPVTGLPMAGIGLPGATGGGLAGLGGLSGLFGGIGAGGAGVGLGFLFKHLFGGAGAAAGAAGGASGAATGALIGSIVPGLGTAIGALIGGLTGLVSGLFGKTKNMKANDARDQFISQFGPAGTGADSGFMKLAAKLTELTGEAGGGSLFKALMDAHNVEDVAKAVEAINAELAKSKDLTTQNTEAIDAQKAKYEELRAQIQSQMDDLNKQLDDINRSEAPEEHMGAIEKAQRESIAKQQDALEKQMQAAQEAQKKALEELGQNSADTIGSLKTPIDDLSDYAIGPAGFGKMGGFFRDELPSAGQDAWQKLQEEFGKGIHIPYDFVATNAPPTAPEPPDNTPGFAFGTPNLGFMNFGTEQLVKLHGKEAVVPESQAATFAAMHTGNAGAVTLVVLKSTGSVDGDLDMILRAAPSIAKNKRGARGILRDALAVR